MTNDGGNFRWSAALINMVDIVLLVKGGNQASNHPTPSNIVFCILVGELRPHRPEGMVKLQTCKAWTTGVVAGQSENLTSARDFLFHFSPTPTSAESATNRSRYQDEATLHRVSPEPGNVD